MGAAIDSKSAANNTAFRKGMGHIVGKFYNLYNPQDLLLRKDFTCMQSTSEHCDCLD